MSLLEVMVLVVAALLLALTLKTYVAEAYEIKGSSMLPTFANGERVVVLKTFYEIERGDIIIFGSQEESGKDLIKRVVALPGEEIEIRDGCVFIDGEPLEERYIQPEFPVPGPEFSPDITSRAAAGRSAAGLGLAGAGGSRSSRGVRTPGRYGGPTIREKVRPNQYYVLGDNRGDSHDSRSFHGVPVESIKGKVVVRWWPLDELRSF